MELLCALGQVFALNQKILKELLGLPTVAQAFLCGVCISWTPLQQVGLPWTQATLLQINLKQFMVNLLELPELQSTVLLLWTQDKEYVWCCQQLDLNINTVFTVYELQVLAGLCSMLNISYQYFDNVYGTDKLSFKNLIMWHFCFLIRKYTLVK